MRKKYLIKNMGCDDTTQTILELSDKEFKIIKMFAKENNKNSEDGCQPTIDIYDFNEYEKYDYKCKSLI